MKSSNKQPPRFDEDSALRSILEGTAAEIGEAFFASLVRSVARALGTHGAWVTEYLGESRRLRALAFWLGDGYVEEYEYDITGTPCEAVVSKTCLVHYPERVIELFPNDPDLPGMNAVAYMGVPLLDLSGSVLGHLAVLDNKPMPPEEKCETIFRIFAERAAAELRRLRAEKLVRERESDLRRLVYGAMDAIIECDRDLVIRLMNPAAEKVFGINAAEAVGGKLGAFLADHSRRTLTRLMARLDTDDGDSRHQWLPEGITGVRKDGKRFPAEGTLSRAGEDNDPKYTLILRDTNEREQALETIRTLEEKAAYLKDELKTLKSDTDLIGESMVMGRLREAIAQVAGTDTTVLIQGETGSGKELVARAVHEASSRADKPLVKVNCAAIPSGLIESEFFGHKKGAFTGATEQREGRFALADGGTILLDEVGELPPELQSKLLRVLQEGEFEPVGASETRKVDVRILAATNRDLEQMVREGKFREDLFYRLNVFPIQVPPLRERGEDITLLAKSFAEQLARRMGRPKPDLTPDCLKQLQSYDWPGNVRELQNVIERALITSIDGQIQPARVVSPDTSQPRGTQGSVAEDERQILTITEFRDFERRNIRRALDACGWKVAGKKGAARLLGLPPSTLTSRMKALEIERD